MNSVLPYDSSAERSPSNSPRTFPIRALGSGGAASPELPPIKAILFDPENVFYDDTLWRRWLRQLLLRMGTPAPFPEFFSRWDLHFRKEVDLGLRDYWDVLRDFLLDAGLADRQIDEVFCAGVCRKQRFESGRRCLPGVNETLRQLSSARVGLYVLANTPCKAEALGSQLAEMGVNAKFHGMATSRDVGHVMPQHAFFRDAVTQFDLDPHATAFVGSDPLRLRGAARLGLTTIAYNVASDDCARFTLERLSELPRLLANDPTPSSDVGIRRVG